MTDAWFVGSEGDRSGPFSTDVLREMAASGRLAPTDLVWREGMAAWAPATSVSGLFATSRPIVAPSLSDNPYAAPAGDRTGSGPASGDAVALGLASRPYSFSAAFELAAHTFKRRWGTLVYIGLILFLVTVALISVQVVPLITALALGVNPNGAGGNVLGLVSLLLGIVTNLAIGPLFAGVTLTTANATLGRSQRGDLLLGFKRWRSVVLANLLVLAIAIGASIVAFLPLGVTSAIMAVVTPGNQTPGPVGMVVLLAALAASFVLFIFAAVAVMRVFFTPVIAADPELGLGVMAALRMSWSRVSIGRACSLFGLFLVAGVVGMLSLIVLFVGSPLIGVPFCFAVLGSAYQLLFRSDRAAKSAG